MEGVELCDWRCFMAQTRRYLRWQSTQDNIFDELQRHALQHLVARSVLHPETRKYIVPSYGSQRQVRILLSCALKDRLWRGCTHDRLQHATILGLLE